MSQYETIMDIAMNLSRVGNWAADDFVSKRKRIETFLSETDNLITQINRKDLPPALSSAVTLFLRSYTSLCAAFRQGVVDPLAWAEEFMTWGNILTHRVQLISPQKQAQA